MRQLMLLYVLHNRKGAYKRHIYIYIYIDSIM